MPRKATTDILVELASDLQATEKLNEIDYYLEVWRQKRHTLIVALSICVCARVSTVIVDFRSSEEKDSK